MSGSYSEFCDNFLLYAASIQKRVRRQPLNVGWYCENKEQKVPGNWQDAVVEDLVRAGLGGMWSENSTRTFLINGAGIARSEIIAESRRDPSRLEKFRRIRPEWWAVFISTLSLATALAALLRTR